jgi:hypothetical protein
MRADPATLKSASVRLARKTCQAASKSAWDGTLAPLTEGSTQQVTTVVRHAGVARVLCYSFTIA